MVDACPPHRSAGPAVPAGPRAQLDPLRRRVGRFGVLLAELPEVLVVVALDERGACGWATAEPDGLLGVYVAVRRRRQGIGRQLVLALLPAARLRWLGVVWRTLALPRSPGEAFWSALRPAIEQHAEVG